MLLSRVPVGLGMLNLHFENKSSMLTLPCRKTQTAIEYCWRFRNMNPAFHIFWIHAGSKVSFDVDYRNLARKLGLTCHTANIGNNEMRDDVKDWLNGNEKWLMVIDNADQYNDFFAKAENEVEDSIQSALPCTRPCTAMIIYTSRHGRVGADLTDHPCLQLDVLSASDGLAMFRSSFQPSRGISPKDCEVLELLEALDFLPLGIAHAIAYLNFTNVSIAHYVHYIEVSDEKLLARLGQNIKIRRRNLKPPESLVGSWQISFELIRKIDNRTANLFCLMACLERQSISSDFIVLFCNWQCQGSNSRSVDMLCDLELPTAKADIDLAIAEIRSLALIISGPDMHHFSMHRYVQAATLRHLSDSGELLTFLEQLAQFILALRDPKSLLASKFTDAQLVPVTANLCLLLSGCHRHTCSNLDLSCELLEDLALASIRLQLNSANEADKGMWSLRYNRAIERDFLET